MVATLVRLRLQVLANNLRRSTWQLVATIIGGLYALGMLALLVAGCIALGVAAPVEVTTTIIVLGGAALTVGWTAFPVLLTGIEQTLDPSRLAQFPIPVRTLLVALTAVGVLGIPGIVTVVAGLATAAAWFRHPVAAAAAVVCSLLGVLIAIVGSRAVASASTGLQGSRRARELTGILILIPLILLGPIIVGLMQGVRSSIDVLPAVATALGWSPLGAAWAVPGAVAAGDAGGALLRLLIASGTLALLVLMWRAALSRALVSPARATTRAVASGRIGAFGWVPQTPAGAVAARCLSYWRRDPRYTRQLISVQLIPLLLWFYSSLNDSSALMLWVGPLTGFIFALALATDISYDGTAFATHLVAGVRGRADRLGRLGALASFAVPITVLFSIGGVALTGEWQHLPSILGLALGALLAGFGAVSISSARFVMPVPAAGDNPFKSAPGATFTTGLQIFVVWGVVLALLVPTAVLVILGFITGSAVFGWSALVVGVVVGLAALLVGVRVGGAVLDRSGPALLLQLRRLQGA
ncbi:transporter [Microbacterium sp.]|uniref:transporter n=1 Tax=Microbacterium sp. TaxID=51671 RepID=UPI003F71D03B